MPRYAAIDVGTNTVLLCVADHEDGRLRTVVDRSIIARLGQGLDAAGFLRDDAMERALAALDRHLNEARSLGAKETAVVGTAALREARNADQFIAEARKRFGVGIKVISGDEEARRAYQAVALDREEGGAARTDALVVMDIGGGSTEFISGRGREVDSVQSLPLGSVRLTERYLPGDPVGPGELERLRAYLAGELAVLRLPPAGNFELTGVAGTNTTLAAMKLKLRTYDAGAIRRARVSQADLDELIDVLASRPVAARRQLPGLEPGRADVILAGAVIAREALAHFEVDAMAVSERGVRHGVIYNLAEGGVS